MTGADVVSLQGTTIEERKAELAAIFGDAHLLSCMEAHLTNTDEPASPEQVKRRMREALKAFSQNPPEFWDMADGFDND